MIESENQVDEGRFLRWLVYVLVIGLSAAWASHRIYRVNVLDKEIRIARDLEGSPMLCANDRSRWCTIRALGDHGRYEIDDILADERGEFSFDQKKYDRNWVTIDLVKHLDRNGEMRYYSSKPTLLPTMLAYIYKGVKAATGKSIEQDTFDVVQIMLILVNVIPMTILLLFMAATLELFSKDTFTKIVLVVAASFGTFLTPFAVTLNNHLPAAISVGIALFAIVLIYKSERTTLIPYFFAGLFSAFAAANELPALSFFCFAGFLLLLRGPMQTVLLFVPGAAIIVAGFFLTNFQAHNDWIPAYAHRTDGEVITTLDQILFDEVEAGNVSAELVAQINRHADSIGFNISQDSVTLAEGQMPLSRKLSKRFVLTQSDESQRIAIVQKKTGRVEVRKWNNWYDYPESRWLIGNKGGVDKGEPDPAVYAFHCLIGHHGIFSLTPMWILSLCGMPLLLFQSGYRRYRWLAVMIIIVSFVVVAFYLTRPLEDRNYGGGTSALRWLLWLAPLWILAAVPFVELLSKSIWGKIAVVILVAASIASAHYSAMNPWVHPWLYELLVKLEWIKPFG